jgi:RHS repeat-associated protein
MLCAAQEEIFLWPLMDGSVLSLAADLLAADPAFAETRIPETSHLAENSRQGFRSTNPASQPGKIAAKSTTALGVSWFRRSQTAVGSGVVYDGDGNRVSETVGSTTTKFLVDDKNPTGLPQAVDELVNGAVTRTYAYGLQRISEDQLINGTWTPSFYGYDGHGNARFLANSAGTITDTYTFGAFGAPIASTGTTLNPYLYSGERFDSALNLYHLRARYYNMLTGRFMAMDPMQGNSCRGSGSCCGSGSCSSGWSSNSYAYASDNPVNRIDPLGTADFAEYSLNLKRAFEEAGEEKAELCGLLLRAELDWCAIFSTDPLGYWACTQKAHLNYYRCLIGLEPL